MENAIHKAATWLQSKLKEDGSYGEQDLACYYKSPFLFALLGKYEQSHRMLDYLKSRYMLPSGDFISPNGKKSENGAFIEYWPYINGWIAMAAQRLGRFDLSYPAMHYLKGCYHSKMGSFAIQKDVETYDVLTAAHLGLMSLYFGDLEKARAAGIFLQKMLQLQPQPQSTFFLRMNSQGELLKNFTQEQAIFFQIDAHQGNQAYFMIGYPIAFLAMLYHATGDKAALQAAEHYLKCAMQCKNIESCLFSHKVAWGAALVAHINKDQSIRKFALTIVDYLMQIQAAEGCWSKDQPAYVSIDQTAEIAIWLKEISRLSF